MMVRKIVITIENELLEKVDKGVSAEQYPKRSNAIKVAVRKQLARWTRDRLARESAKLDRDLEQKLAEEGLGDLTEWPEY